MIFLFCSVVSFILILLLLDMRRPIKYPPGPPFLPILGNFLDYKRRLKILGYHHLVWMNLHKMYGEVVGLKLGRNRVVCVFGANAVKDILNREEFDGRPDGFFFRMRTFGKRLDFFHESREENYEMLKGYIFSTVESMKIKILHLPLQNKVRIFLGIVFSDGLLWKKQRKFSLQHLRSFGFGRREMEEKILEETRTFIDILKDRCAQPVLMHNIFDVSVLNGLWAMMAGQRFEIDDSRLRKLLKIIHDAFRVVDMSGGLLNQMPLIRFISPRASGYKKLREVLDAMWEFLGETISDHRKTVCMSYQQPRDLIDAFLQQIQVNNDASFTDDQLMSLCLDLFMAGAETTSNTLGFAMQLMAEHSDIQKKVQDEMDDVVGRNRWPCLNDRLRLRYTEAVLMEIQRRTNIAPLGIAHRATKNTKFHGYHIPEGTIVLTNLYSIHMDPDYWQDPMEFRPERFIDVNGNHITHEPYYLPFGAGKRRCLGESLGKANIFLFFTSVLHNFILEKADESSEYLGSYDGVTLAPKPFKLKLIPRKD